MRVLFILYLALVLMTATLGAQSEILTYEELQTEFTAQAKPISYFDQLSLTQSKNPWVFHFRGLSEEEAGLDEKAWRSFQKAQELQPEQAWHWQTLGNHWSGRADFAQAARCYERAVDLEQREEPAQALRAQAKDARRRRQVKADNIQAFDESSGRITILGLIGICFIGLIYFFVPRFLR